LTPDMRILPIIEDVDPCAALGCAMQVEPIETCRDHRCPHRWIKESRLDRAERARKDAIEAARILTVDPGGPA
jgi:hypothetical protein